MIVVAPLEKIYTLVIEDEEQGIPRIEFDFTALNFHQKNIVNTQTTNIKQGKVTIDRTLTSYLTLKYGLKDVRGLKNPDGSEYKLRFQEWDGTKEVTEDCISELMNLDLADGLMFLGLDLLNKAPKELINPLTKQPILGCEIIDKDKDPEDLPESKKK